MAGQLYTPTPTHDDEPVTLYHARRLVATSSRHWVVDSSLASLWIFVDLLIVLLLAIPRDDSILLVITMIIDNCGDEWMIIE